MVRPRDTLKLRARLLIEGSWKSPAPRAVEMSTQRSDSHRHVPAGHWVSAGSTTWVAAGQPHGSKRVAHPLQCCSLSLRLEGAGCWSLRVRGPPRPVRKRNWGWTAREPADGRGQKIHQCDDNITSFAWLRSGFGGSPDNPDPGWHPDGLLFGCPGARTIAKTS